MRRSLTSRKVKTTVISTTPILDDSTSGLPQTSVYTTTAIKRSGELRDEGDKARSKRAKKLQTQPSGARAAANAVVASCGASQDDDVPLHPESPYEYDYDVAWSDEDELPVITHAGGEVEDMAREAYRYIISPGYTYKKGRGLLNERRARLQASMRSWENQMDALVDMYLDWKAGEGDEEEEMSVDLHEFEVTAIGTFTRYIARVRCLAVQQKPDEEANVALIRVGMIGCSPSDPSVAISLDTLELYHRLRRRNGQLSIQAMARTLCDLHNHTYLTYHRDQFSVAFDVYLDILRRVKFRTDSALGQDTPNWRALNACPACNYELDGEVPLVPRALHVVDGNYSMKRAANAGLVDQRVFKSDYLISREEVNRFQYEVKGRAKDQEAADCKEDENDDGDSPAEGDAPWVGLGTPGDAADGQEVETPCTKNWRAAQEKQSALVIYEINGGFPMACRHGMIEAFSEIVRSGELAKYPLAATSFLLNVFGENQGLGFDIACSFESTIKNSPMLGAIANAKGLQVIVNAFHGWAHNRLCQLKYHPLYRTGMGLEDLETLERFFSSSNTIARTIRHATSFHWHQAVDLHFRQWDEQKYQELSKFLYNNYEQALKLIRDYAPGVRAFKERLRIDDDHIDGWLVAERKFLEELKEEPEERVVACAYVEALQTRHKADDHWQAISDETLNPPTALVEDYAASVRWTSRIEASRRAAQEEITVAIRAVADLEIRLLLKEPWTEDTPEYKDTIKYIHQRKYHRALNKLEQLVVQRLFELSKANVVGMGYKLRESVWRALKTRGKAIRNALNNYNKIAPKMNPPAPQLQWKQLMEYTFISEFELLKHAHSHQNISVEPWAIPLNREMAIKHHKIKRAYEEIDRINHEAPRLRASIHNEHNVYQHHIGRLLDSDPNSTLARELQRMYSARQRVNSNHIERLNALEALVGYTGKRGLSTRKEAPNCGGDLYRGGAAHKDPTLDDIWRQGGTDASGTDNIEQDGPDDEISERILDLTEHFSADLRLVNGVPENMLYDFAL